VLPYGLGSSKSCSHKKLAAEKFSMIFYMFEKWFGTFWHSIFQKYLSLSFVSAIDFFHCNLKISIQKQKNKLFFKTHP